MRPIPRRARLRISSGKLRSARVRASVGVEFRPRIRTEVAEDRVNLLGLPRSELEAFVAERLEAKPFRARQLMNWIYRRGAAVCSVMPDFAQDLRARPAMVAQ